MGAYVFSRASGSHLADLPAAAAEQFRFRRSVAVDGDVVVVGADGRNSWTGGAYVYRTSGQQQVILSALDATEYSYFGASVAVDDDLIVVGALRSNGGRGSVYTFDTTGQQLGNLAASDSSARFGTAVDVDDGIIVVGAPGNVYSTPGSAYIFNTAGNQMVARLDGEGAVVGDNFGMSVAVDGDVVVVGAHGKDNWKGEAHIYDAAGIHVETLAASDGVALDSFGKSVDVSNGVVAVGASGTLGTDRSRGSVYIYNSISGQRLAKLEANDAADSDFLGVSVAMDDGVAVVGSYAGKAYIFDVSKWAGTN